MYNADLYYKDLFYI